MLLFAFVTDKWLLFIRWFTFSCKLIELVKYNLWLLVLLGRTATVGLGFDDGTLDGLIISSRCWDWLLPFGYLFDIDEVPDGVDDDDDAPIYVNKKICKKIFDLTFELEFFAWEYSSIYGSSCQRKYANSSMFSVCKKRN